MPLKLISNLVTSFFKRIDTVITPPPKESASSASVSFSPTITIQGIWTKKDDQSDMSTIKSSADSERWIAHQEQLQKIYSQPPIFDPSPSVGIHDYELIETLGRWFIQYGLHQSHLFYIGTGTFGRVYLAKEKKAKKYYAIKVLKKAEIVKLKQVEHINSEREVLSQINFPFIVQL